MFIELTDQLRCPADHPESFLVLIPDEMEGRRVVRGTLGCPVCHAEYRIEAGVADFQGAPLSRGAVPRDSLAPGSRQAAPAGRSVVQDPCARVAPSRSRGSLGRRVAEPPGRRRATGVSRPGGARGVCRAGGGSRSPCGRPGGAVARSALRAGESADRGTRPGGAAASCARCAFRSRCGPCGASCWVSRSRRRGTGRPTRYGRYCPDFVPSVKGPCRCSEASKCWVWLVGGGWGARCRWRMHG